MYTAKESYKQKAHYPSFCKLVPVAAISSRFFLCTTLYIAISIQVATKKQPLIKRTVFLLDYAGASASSLVSATGAAGFFSSALRSEE